MAEAYLSEVFASIQGEGPDAGSRALFIRFGGCNLSCGYCDTDYARERAPSFSVSGYAGASGETSGEFSGEFSGEAAGDAYADLDVPNPADCDEVLRIISQTQDLPDTVVLTGGEPLMQEDALARLAGELRMRGCSVHLETNGTLPAGLERVKQIVDFVSMDIKIPSMLGGVDLGVEHAGFLEVMEGMKGCVKIVVSDSVAYAEMEWAARLIANVNPAIPVFIQPVFIGSRPGIGAARLAALQARLAARLSTVRVSIQLHKILGVR
jgi:organic radical activating enzyme